MALEQSAELRELFLRYYQALEQGDVGMALDLVSREQGTLSIGTDPNEWWSDYSTLERVFALQLAEMRDAGVRFLPGDPQCYAEGSVGWGADRARIVLPSGMEQGIRLTAVFHREGNDWKMVQSHASLGVPNTEALGTDLTT